MDAVDKWAQVQISQEDPTLLVLGVFSFHLKYEAVHIVPLWID